MKTAASLSNHGRESPRSPAESFGNRVRRAVIWRSGSQVIAQLVQWATTFLVIRILDPGDYGLYAMASVVLGFLNLLNGEGLASGLIQQRDITPHQIRQLFGMLIVLNVGLGLIQLALAPLAAAYYQQEVVAQILRVQALLYLTTPFIALPFALLSRTLDFRHLAKANIVAAFASAAAALGAALLGWGVWTLVVAPIVLFTVRGAMMTWSARSLVWPSFDFRGAGGIARYGGVIAAGQLFWFLQSEIGVFIAGRHFSPHLLGIYTTALFLTQIVVSKFVPALNEVAFSAYAQLQHDRDALAAAFVRAVGVIMLATLPLYLGLAVTAEPLVLTVLGPKWMEMAPVVRLLALAMPFMTLQVLYAPACDARGRPGIGVRNGAAGAVIMGTAFLVGVSGGPVGLAWSWLAGYPVYLAVSTWQALPVIGTTMRAIASAVMPCALAAIAMAVVVHLADAILPPLDVYVRLAVLIATGAAVYGAWLAIFARATVREFVAMVRKQPLPAD